jgi:hypothetical protein
VKKSKKQKLTAEETCPICGQKMEKVFDVKYVCMKCSDVVMRDFRYVPREQKKIEKE